MADVGRPTVMDEMTVNKLEEAFSYGASDEQACFYAGISKQTLYSYQDKYPEFVDRKFALKENTKYQAKLNVSKKVQAGDVSTSQWYLERRDDDFKPKSKTETEVSGVLKIEDDPKVNEVREKYEQELKNLLIKG